TVLRVVKQEPRSDLPEVAHTLDRVGALARAVERRKQNRNEYRDDADDDEEFHQRKSFPTAHGMAPYILLWTPISASRGPAPLVQPEDNQLDFSSRSRASAN